MQAIVVESLGSAEVLRPGEVPPPEPGAGELLVRVAAAGVNFMDVRQRRGIGPPRPVPFVPGWEGSGTVVEVGDDVTGLAVGDRVAWNMTGSSYAEQVLVAAGGAVPVPDGIGDLTAAAVMIQGLTSHHLAAVAARVLDRPGRVLVHAAAGGVGSLLTQMLRRQGHHVVGTVSAPAKAAAAARGADEVVVAGAGELEEALAQRYGEAGFDAVYDGVGAATFPASLRQVRSEGLLAYFGQASGPVPPVDLFDLPRSILLTKPVVLDHVPAPERLRAVSSELFSWIADGSLIAPETSVYPLAEAAAAHVALESRASTGKLLLVP
ncbi:alcohol dehydrogenase catalytic domain-containing protein [Nocardioides humi]|uniref:Quinone oxidoreductase n=1 Tax=Nocardioides humi TaxID=449461 RepID=A0ABN2BFN2_9ACTN|nr:zinc-binding dehydrogenase [Nocardioides humi]